MKNLLIEILKTYYGIDVTKPLNCPEYVAPVVEKTAGEKLYEFSLNFYDTDPTPKDIQPDEYACVESLTAILSVYFKGDFKSMTYTPTLLEYLKTDKRFKQSLEFKTGSIILSPTKSGAGRIVGHVGIIGKDGKIFSNSSATGKWFDKFDIISWIDRYSRVGGLDMYIFELK